MIAIPVLLVGGTEFQTLSVVRILLADGYTVVVCCYYEFDPAVVAQFEAAGADVILLGLRRTNGRLGALGVFPLIQRLIKVFKAYRPDVVHVQYVAPGLLPILAARLAGIRTVFATIHIAGSIVYGRKATALLRAAAWFCSAFFCVSRDVEEFWFGDSIVFGGEDSCRRRKHFTIYNAVDVSRIKVAAERANHQELRQHLGLTGKRVIGIVGRLAFQKGHTVLLDAMVKVVHEVPDAVLIIVGDGAERSNLEMQSRRLMIEPHIRWLGSQEPEQVYQLYGVMDVFAMPSLFEGFGLTAAEAMAAGCPVVASAADGLREIVIDGHTGILVPCGDSDRLAKALIKVLQDPEAAKEMGLNGQKRVEQEFSLEQFRESMLAVYRYLLPSSVRLNAR